jgi:hypothetical protein
MIKPTGRITLPQPAIKRSVSTHQLVKIPRREEKMLNSVRNPSSARKTPRISSLRSGDIAFQEKRDKKDGGLKWIFVERELLFPERLLFLDGKAGESRPVRNPGAPRGFDFPRDPARGSLTKVGGEGRFAKVIFLVQS